MPRFVLLDHSLSDYVGHHYAYARLVLAAARDAGFQPVLAASRRLGDLGPDFPEVEVHRLFRYSTYCRHTYDARHRIRRTRDVEGGLRAALGEIFTRAGRGRRVRAFADGCAALVRAVPLQDGDVVFAATMSELDFAGLAQWLASEPATRHARWRVQFHINLFRGRDPDYAGQEATAAKVRDVFDCALAGLAEHRLRLFCTTEPLARQYRRVGVGRFDVLPYPVDEIFRPRSGPTRSEPPLRVALLGHSRREKGYSHMPGLVDALWDRYLRTGLVQLVVQARPGKVRLALPSDARPGTCPVVFADVGLPREQYVDLVRQTDLGLLLYDADRYYTRCSGVLIEMLCAGIPVLVPAASWLSEQITEPIQRHLDIVAASADSELAVGSAKPVSADPAAETTPDEFVLDALPPGATDLLVSFAWTEPIEPGVYVRLEAKLYDPSGAETGGSVHVLGPREGTLPTRAIVRIAENVRSVRLCLRDAHGTSAVAIRDLSIRHVGGSRDRPVAAGAVGLVAAEPSLAHALVRELIEHHEHYRRTAAAFGSDLRERLNAAEVVRSVVAD